MIYGITLVRQILPANGQCTLRAPRSHKKIPAINFAGMSEQTVYRLATMAPLCVSNVTRRAASFGQLFFSLAQQSPALAFSEAALASSQQALSPANATGAHTKAATAMDRIDFMLA
jgi:hypothetical protein